MTLKLKQLQLKFPRTGSKHGSSVHPSSYSPFFRNNLNFEDSIESNFVMGELKNA